MPPLPSPTPDALLTALAAAPSPLALLAGDGRLHWCNAAFARLFTPPAAAGAALAQWLGDAALQRLTAGDPVALADPGAAWQLRLADAGAEPAAEGLRALSAEPAAPAAGQPGDTEAATLRAQIAALQERLELVQEFGRIGVFERDPVTMRGRWDAHMYRIWGLPEPPAGAPSPPYGVTASMIFDTDRRDGAFSDTLRRPGPHSQRVRIRRPDGQVRHVHTQWKVFHDAAGQPQRVLGVNIDDTEVHELANRAEQLRTELQVALDLGHIALWRFDLVTERLVLDARGCEIIGLPWRPEGFTLEEARARIHPDDRPQADASARLTLRTGAPSDMQLRYEHPGGLRQVLLRRALQRSADGTPVGFVGVMLDVTAQVEGSRRALDAARRLEAAAEAARIGLWTTEPGSALPRWNARMFALFGLDPAQGPLRLTDWLDRCVHADDLARVRAQALDWWHRGDGSLECEFRVVRPADGALRWLVVRGVITRQGDPPLRRAEGVVLDITEQQQTLRQLRDTVERMTLTTRALGLGSWEMDNSGDTAIWDAQMFRLRGITSERRRVTPEEAIACLHPDDRDAVVAWHRTRVHNGQSWQTSFRVVLPDGRERWITSFSAPLLDAQGREERRIGVNWDSTESHVAAQALQERALAVAESQAKSQAMSRISHELRTPLNAVLGFTQLLRGSGDDSAEARERRQRWLAHIDDAGRHLLALIDDVLELSRAEAGVLRLAQQTLACADFVPATLPLVAAEAQLRQVQLHSGALPGRVLADPVRLRQVLINLLTNAIKFNRPGGLVRVHSTLQGAMVALHVADTGIGIAPQQLEDAFEPFNRLGAEHGDVEGSGIGLAIVKVLVEHMGGQVQARSTPGEGSVFSVLLPAADGGAAAAAGTADATEHAATPPAAHAAAAAAAAAQRAQLLYIEDNPVNALLVQELLAARPGVALEIATDGASGVARAQALQPTLILVDMQLPDMDGHAVLQALRADPRTADIRCVVLSANATPADVAAARAAGFVDYWTKPIEFTHFLDSLGTLLGRRL
ncbi:PAS domain-containing protein [Rubrivivax sp. RP6-9]|uniref:hybrid sensor histidine kinase/response regulator n=1 Tax=Rubrivivax sp. RP6-9 TaxID=3415750 RepID=UPI003CC6D85C